MTDCLFCVESEEGLVTCYMDGDAWPFSCVPLLTRYNTYEKALELVSGGDILFLQDNMNSRGLVRETKSEDNGSRVFQSWSQMVSESDCSFYYLYKTEKEAWYYSKDGSNIRRLTKSSMEEEYEKCR